MTVGRIQKINRDVYEVAVDDEVVLCIGRGVFRNQKIKPLVGDEVTLTRDDENLSLITAIHPRKNELVRPPIANIDQVILVFSAKEPDFSLFLLDRFLTVIESYQADLLIVVTKMDLLTADEKQAIEKSILYYQSIGYTFILVDALSEIETSLFKERISQQVSVLAGQSGVGKSTLLNRLAPTLQLETNEISSALGRGKHTTRHVQLLPLYDGFIADSPGFSSLDFDHIEKEEIQFSFIEFLPLREHCKFSSCLHVKEPKCAVKAAVESGEILSTRYEHYIHFLEETMNRKPRY